MIWKINFVNILILLFSFSILIGSAFAWLFNKNTNEMKSAFSVYSLMLGLFFSFAIFSSYSKDESPDNRVRDNTYALPQKIKSVDLGKSFDFSGEFLPMENFDVKERLDRELMVNAYWHSNTVLNIKLARRYFPVFEKILAENGVPDDFKYLAVAESGLRNLTSPAGAKGIWQFMKGTGKEYGLEINKEVDERLHIEKATRAACDYLKSLKERFGSWTLAAAAYNMGATNLRTEMETQHAQTYYDLNINEETSRYIFRLVAIKEIINQPELFGFELEEDQHYMPLDDFSVLSVDGPVESLGELAGKYGTTYRHLKVYNPWLLTSRLTNSAKKVYKIKIPRK